MSGPAGRIVAVVVTAAVLGVSTSAAVANVDQKGWKHALWIRSDALNRVHHLGDYRLDTMHRS
jgi:hypothetical protein